MAALQLPPPKPMNCLKGDTEMNWKEFKEAYEDYIIATKISKEEKTVQSATLKTVMGSECRKILRGLKLTEDKLKDPKEILQIIAKVTDPTDWLSSLLVVKKPNKLRVCIDPKPLNQALRRSNYLMPTIEDVLPKLAKARIFSVLDAKDGFWQIKLTEESSYLTTFGSPFGRYRWLRMPFGICTAPEEFQRRQHEIVEDLPGVEVIADDYLIYGSGDTDQEAEADHDRNLIRFLEKARRINLKINRKKARLRLKSVPYMGHVITAEGLQPDPEKVQAIIEMPRPENKKGVQRLIGCVTYLSKFLPSLSKVAEPLRRLTDTDAHYEWLDHHEESFQTIKTMLTSAPVLKYYDLREEVTIQCDASEKGLGATLMQNKQPVCFASQALTITEENYAQIEKECLAIVFACEKFDQFIYGRDKITVHTDHKPLIPIFQKPIHTAPKRLQRMLLRLQKYELQVQHIPGKDMLIADCLSRAYLKRRKHQHQIFDELEHINQLDYVNVTTSTQHQLQNATKADAELMELMLMVQHGWPDQRSEVPISIRQYYNYREEITMQNGIMFKGQRIIVPKSMQPLMLKKTHSSHQGVQASIRRAKDSLFWPGMGSQIEETVTNCSICNSMQPKQQKESMMSWEIPDRPWQIVAQDLFHCNNKDYLITVDFYSDYWEIDQLEDTTAKTVIKFTKQQFSRHGIPQKVVTDNGPQFVAEEYEKFARDWDIEHRTSSPRHSQANGKAESAVKIAKKLIKKAHKDHCDIHLTILDWRNTPNPEGKSPVQMLMSRRTRTLLPVTAELLQPKVVVGVPEDIKARKQKAKAKYDRTAKDLPELDIGETVRIQPDQPKQPWKQAICLQKVGPRSYLVQTEDGHKYRRNRKFLRTTSEEFCIRSPNVENIPTEPSVSPETPRSPSTTKPTSKSLPKSTSKSTPKSTSKSLTKSTEKSTEKSPAKSSSKTTMQACEKSANQSSSSTKAEFTAASVPSSKTTATKSTRTRSNIQQPAKYRDYEMT